MCKLAGWTSSAKNQISKSRAEAAVLACKKVFVKSERDGFGFAQPSDAGLIGRYADPSDFIGLDEYTKLSALAGKAFTAFDVCHNADQYGTYSPHSHMMVHGRTATCGVSLKNTHPFRKNGWTLAHNGVVSWNGESNADRSAVTCDSEHLLLCMEGNSGDPDKQRESLLDISGYAAFLAQAPSGQMIVARDDMASLYSGITKDGNWLFGTTAEIVEVVAEAMKFKGVSAHKLSNWSWLTFSSRGGDPEVSTWRHGTAKASHLSLASKSLGSTYQLPDTQYLNDDLINVQDEEYAELDSLGFVERQYLEYEDLRYEKLTHREALLAMGFTEDKLGIPSYK